MTENFYNYALSITFCITQISSYISSVRERTVAVLVSMGADCGALTDPSPEFPSGRTAADLASSNGHKGISGFLAESSLTSHLESLTVDDKQKGGQQEISGTKAVQTVSERTATPVVYNDMPDGLCLKDSLTAVRNATQAADRIHQVFRMQSFQRKQLTQYEDDEFGLSDQRALSLLASKVCKSGQRDGLVNVAATQIQKKFRGWKKRKEFLIIRERIVKIQVQCSVLFTSSFNFKIMVIILNRFEVLVEVQN